jgi:hypothetical protein
MRLETFTARLDGGETELISGAEVPRFVKSSANIRRASH